MTKRVTQMTPPSTQPILPSLLRVPVGRKNGQAARLEPASDPLFVTLRVLHFKKKRVVDLITLWDPENYLELLNSTSGGTLLIRVHAR